MFGVTEFITR